MSAEEPRSNAWRALPLENRASRQSHDEGVRRCRRFARGLTACLCGTAGRGDDGSEGAGRSLSVNILGGPGSPMCQSWRG